jgi:2-polyprenyl-6-methoxyphenol hydroxylase-like FAD-dependent oxidoreductase
LNGEESALAKSYEVVISGGGAVGPALAIELSLRGVSVLVVEQTERGAYKAPRTNLTNIRSMEHFRRWGIADTHRAAVPIDPEFPDDFAFVTRLNGYELVRFENAVASSGRNELFSENAVWAEQGTIEKTLRDRVEAAPSAEYRWGTRVVGFDQTDDSVRVQLEHVATGERDEVECQYLAGCDGSRGVVRRELGIRLEGKPDLNVNSGMSVHAPSLKSLCRVGLAVMYWFVNDDVGGWLGPLDAAGNWFFHVINPLPANADPDSFEDMRRLLYMCVGADFPVEYVSGGKWVTHSLMAPTMQKGRVFIAGDAAHLIPPTGGFGMNISILDGVDLGWKLAATLGGWGGPRLLDAYTIERHGADRWVIAAQENNNRIKSEELHQEGMEAPGDAGEKVRERVKHTIVTEKAQEFASLGCQLGYRYENSPIVVDDGSPWPEVSQPVYVPSAHPGCLAPHRWLADDRSLYDVFGPEFTLLKIGGNGGSEAERIVNAACDRRVPLEFVEVSEPGMRELYEAELVLIRPDQHVAWRGDVAPENPAALVDQVRGA